MKKVVSMLFILRLLTRGVVLWVPVLSFVFCVEDGNS